VNVSCLALSRWLALKHILGSTSLSVSFFSLSLILLVSVDLTKCFRKFSVCLDAKQGSTLFEEHAVSGQLAVNETFATEIKLSFAGTSLLFIIVRVSTFLLDEHFFSFSSGLNFLHEKYHV